MSFSVTFVIWSLRGGFFSFYFDKVLLFWVFHVASFIQGSAPIAKWLSICHKCGMLKFKSSHVSDLEVEKLGKLSSTCWIVLPALALVGLVAVYSGMR